MMTVIAAGPGVSALVATLLRRRALPPTGTIARGTAAATLGEMAGQGSPHVSFRSRGLDRTEAIGARERPT